MGQPVVMENHPGAAGTLASEQTVPPPPALWPALIEGDLPLQKAEPPTSRFQVWHQFRHRIPARHHRNCYPGGDLLLMVCQMLAQLAHAGLMTERLPGFRKRAGFFITDYTKGRPCGQFSRWP